MLGAGILCVLVNVCLRVFLCMGMCAWVCVHWDLWMYACTHMNVQEISGRMRAEPIPLQLQVNKAVLTKDRSVCTYFALASGCSNPQTVS
jgi:hypothetical protein